MYCCVISDECLASTVVFSLPIAAALKITSDISSFSVCPDPVDRYLEETSVRYISPRGAVQSTDTAPHRRTGGSFRGFVDWLCYGVLVHSLIS